MTTAKTIEDLHQRLLALAPTVQLQARQADRTTELSSDVVAVLKDAGLFKLWVPQTCGGLELDLPATLRVYETAARIDGSLGWAVMIGCGGGLFAAYLEAQAASELFSPSDALVAGSGAPSGRAERVAGGYRASGRWRYASGARYATVFTANCIVTSGGTPVRNASGDPLIRAMSFDASNVAIIPTWDATGMRGTGSHDFEVTEVFVPEAHTFSVFTDTVREPGTLYRLPFDVLTQLPVAAVGVGLVRHALDSFAVVAARKKDVGSGTFLAANPLVCSQYAASHACWLSVHLALHALANRTWQSVTGHGALNSLELADIAASCVFFMSQLASATEQLARIAGMNAVLHDDALARAWRDLQTLAAHVSVSPLQNLQAGAMLLEGTRAR
jgi:alkylation response protein AidB-like acyl-CoA dehydrogenase